MGNKIKLCRPPIDDAVLKIFDLSGKVEAEIPISAEKMYIDIPTALPMGVHFAVISSDNGLRVTGKLVIIK